MTTPTVDPQAIAPTIRDISAGRPARIAGVPVPLNAPKYTLGIFRDDTWGSTQLFQSTESEPGLPIFFLSAQDTASLGTLLAANSAGSFDSTGAAIGWYRIDGVGTDPENSNMVRLPSSNGPLVVRLDPGLTRRPAAPYYPAADAGCGCGGNVLNALPCGCGGCTSSTPCDHPPIDPGACSVLTQRARFKGTYQGEYDPLHEYVQWDVVSAGDRNFVYVCGLPPV